MLCYFVTVVKLGVRKPQLISVLFNGSFPMWTDVLVRITLTLCYEWCRFEMQHQDESLKSSAASTATQALFSTSWNRNDQHFSTMYNVKLNNQRCTRLYSGSIMFNNVM